MKNKFIILVVLLLIIAVGGIFAWQYFVRPAPQEVEEEVKEEVVKKNLIVVKDKNNDFRLIDSAGVEYAILRTGVENKIMQWGAGLLSYTPTPQIIGDKIFFIERGIERVLKYKYIDLNNNLKEFEFVQRPSSTIISPDGQKIAWMKSIKGEKFEDNIAQLIVSDINGKDIRIVFEEIFLKEERDGIRLFEFIRLIGWSEDSKRIYFTKNRITDEGMGGYMPLGIDGGENFFVIDVDNGQVSKLIEDWGGIVNFSPNENIISFVNFDSIDNKLSIRTYNWENGEMIENTTIPIPMLKEYGHKGNIFFSPSRKHVLFSTAVGDRGNERFSVFIADTDGTNLRRVINKDPNLIGVGWLSDDEIILTDYWKIKGTHIINRDGSGLRKISEYVFIGLMEFILQ